MKSLLLWLNERSLIALLGILILPVYAQAIPQDLLKLRAQARGVVSKSHCASCHTPSSQRAQKAALKIFDLSSQVWSSSMTDSQLDRLRWVFEDASPEEIAEMLGPNSGFRKPNPKETSTVSNFVKQELQFRLRNPEHRFAEIQRKNNPEFFQLMNTTNAGVNGCTL